MEFHNNKSNYNIINDNFKEFKDAINQLKEKIKANGNLNNIYEIFCKIKEDEIYLYFIFFQNFEIWININFDISNNYEMFQNMKNLLDYIKLNKEENTNIYSLFVFMIFYIYFKLINYWNITLNINYCEINKIRYLLKETCQLIAKLFKANIIKENEMYDFIHLIFFFIESKFLQNLFSDKVQTGKNLILFNELFFLLQKLFLETINKFKNQCNSSINIDNIHIESINKSSLSKFFGFLEEFKNNIEINSKINRSILLNNDIILNFINYILAKFDLKIIENFEPKFLDILYDFVLKFIRNNYKLSKIYDVIFQVLKRSFINLYSFEENINKIHQDLFINSFYLGCLKKSLFGKESTEDKEKNPNFDCYYFNGYDSQISLTIQNNNFEKSSLFFSFNLSSLQERNIYPLLLIQKDFDKRKIDVLKVYIKAFNKNNIFYLCEYHEDQENNLNFEIKSNTTYYLCICFNIDQLLIKIREKKGTISSYPKIKKSNKLLSIKSISLSFGFFKKRIEVFSGYIGPIMILSNPKKSDYLNDFIDSVLNLENNYKDYITFCRNIEFIKEEDLIFHTKKIDNIKYKIDKEECLLYMIPQNFLFFNNQSGIINRLPSDDNFCNIQGNYNIQNINVTLFKYRKDIYEFINDNGLDYISLLYEYLYQFSEYYFNSFIPEEEIKKNKNTFLKYITVIFKDSLFIIEKIYHEIKVEEFIKSLKQIYMNLFSCLQIITKYSDIIDELIASFFNIIDYYHQYFSQLNKKLLKSNKKDINEISESNLAFMNGWIDFLLNPEIYNFKNQKILISLFNHLSSYFIYIWFNKPEDKINKTIYIKLISFIDYLYDNYYDEDSINFDTNNDGNQKNKSVINQDEENNIFNIFLKPLKSFYDNNPSKNENINNFKNMFKYINENLNENNKTFFIFYKFINTCISKDVFLYFNDDQNDEQILSLIKVVNKFISSRVLLKKSSENKKEDLNKAKIIEKLISEITSILMRILLTKEKLSNNIQIVMNFIIKNLEISDNLIHNVVNEIRMIFTQYLLGNHIQNISEKDNKNIIKKKQNSNEELNISLKYYNDIFYIFRFVLEGRNLNSENKIKNENEILGLFKYIISMMNASFEEDKRENSLTQNSVNIDYNSKFLDLVCCTINFLKFYHNIFFKNIYPEKYIDNFINLCYKCYNSGLIYSTILIQIEENSDVKKTALEIILDICIFYINLSTNISFENLNKQNDINKETIIKEQTSIYCFLEYLFNIEENNSKQIKKRETIFYINDYFRYLSSIYPKHGKKKPKKEPLYNEYSIEFNNMQNIDELFIKDKKFNLNFSTFFLLKLIGYNKILIELTAKYTNSKSDFKYGEILPLIFKAMEKIHKEHEALYSKAKNFFFPKNLNISFSMYCELKREIEVNLKKIKNYSDIDNKILNILYNENEQKVFYSIYSSLCLDEKEENKVDNRKKRIKHILSFNKDKEKFEDINIISKTFTNVDDTQKKLILGAQAEETEFDNSTEKKLRKVSDENEFELHFSEISSSETYKNNLFEDNSTNEITNSSSSNDKNINKNKKNNASNINFTSRTQKRKKTNISFLSVNSNDSNQSNTISYLNYFYQPDEYLLKNAKKQLLLSVFSFYFFDSFFNNDSFKLLKKYYTKNFTGIQNSTKLLNYPSKIKIFNNGLEPYLFLKPNTKFFENKNFSVTHDYFCENSKSIHINESIILYKKILPELYFENKFDKSCELIRMDHSWYGHMIGSENSNYIIFEKLNYDFYEEIEDNKKAILSKDKTLDFMKIFSLTYINKKPKIKASKTNLPIINKGKRFKRKKIVIILFDEIEEIIERRFLLMWQAIEIFLKNGKSYFFNFLSKEQKDFILDIFEKNPKTKNKIQRKSKFQSIIKMLMNEWQEGQLTTYEYLLFLNKYATRTYNDVNQYPVFPWIIKKIIINSEGNTRKPEIRNFKYPMASQTEENRDSALIRYKDDEAIGQTFPIHYGTHYSTSSYVYFYLMREEPFTNLLIKLQGNKQENPDRMFYSLIDTLYILETGHDNRECIPDIFCKIEQFINLNCVNFGKKNIGVRVDDFNIYIYDDQNEVDKNILLNYNNYSISDYINFILNQIIYLNSKKIANEIIDWFDIIFGVGQLPEKDRKNCLNIFNEESYEQRNDLYKLLEDLKSNNQNLDNIITLIGNKIDLMLSFGQTPYQILKEKHPKHRKKKKLEQKEKEKSEELDELDGDFENQIETFFWPKDYKNQIKILPIYFEIYPSISKIFLIDSKRNLEIRNSNFYDSNAMELENGNFETMQLPHIKFFDKKRINGKFYYIYKQKYCFCPFRTEINFKEKDDNYSVHLYSNSFINKISNQNKNQSREKNKKIEELIFITCRYSDNSFKIHVITKDKQKKEKENKHKVLSIICEDFVNSVCTLDNNKFLVGLNNGKLIQYSLYKEIIDNKSKSSDYKIKIKIDKKIQAHKKSINVIEVDFKLGIIITGGDDSYLFIRKIYDLELLTPIKLKSKYIITMAKLSPLNFLYVQCFNTKKEKNIIFGYTLNGLYFAKSKYAYFDSLAFTNNGNIVTFVNKNDIEILNGYDLKNLEIKGNKKWKDIKKKISEAAWVNFNIISRRDDLNENKINSVSFTYFDLDKKKNTIYWLESADVTDIKVFE